MSPDVETAPPTGASPSAAAPLPSYVCDDCGKGFEGDPAEHYRAAHGAMPRMRYSDAENSYIECRHSSHKEPWIETADLGDHSTLSEAFGTPGRKGSGHARTHKKGSED